LIELGCGRKMRVEVLRLFHRCVRDHRVTTHLFLTARAFGANGVIYSGLRDSQLEDRILRTVDVWGGPFHVEFHENWKQAVANWKKKGGEVIHLTMYGLPLESAIKGIKDSSRDKLVIVGGAKVPLEVYELSDWNVSISNQPHSEVSALSIFLHELFEGKELSKAFKDAKIRIMPQRKGKKVVEL